MCKKPTPTPPRRGNTVIEERSERKYCSASAVSTRNEASLINRVGLKPYPIDSCLLRDGLSGLVKKEGFLIVQETHPLPLRGGQIQLPDCLTPDFLLSLLFFSPPPLQPYSSSTLSLTTTRSFISTCMGRRPIFTMALLPRISSTSPTW